MDEKWALAGPELSSSFSFTSHHHNAHPTPHATPTSTTQSPPPDRPKSRRSSMFVNVSQLMGGEQPASSLPPAPPPLDLLTPPSSTPLFEHFLVLGAGEAVAKDWGADICKEGSGGTHASLSLFKKTLGGLLSLGAGANTPPPPPPSTPGGAAPSTSTAAPAPLALETTAAASGSSANPNPNPSASAEHAPAGSAGVVERGVGLLSMFRGLSTRSAAASNANTSAAAAGTSLRSASMDEGAAAAGVSPLELHADSDFQAFVDSIPEEPSPFSQASSSTPTNASNNASNNASSSSSPLPSPSNASSQLWAVGKNMGSMGMANIPSPQKISGSIAGGLAKLGGLGGRVGGISNSVLSKWVGGAGAATDAASAGANASEIASNGSSSNNAGNAVLIASVEADPACTGDADTDNQASAGDPADDAAPEPLLDLLEYDEPPAAATAADKDKDKDKEKDEAPGCPGGKILWGDKKTGVCVAPPQVLFHYPPHLSPPSPQVLDFCLPLGCKISRLARGSAAGDDDSPLQEIFYSPRLAKRSERCYIFFLEDKTESYGAGNPSSGGVDEESGVNVSKLYAICVLVPRLVRVDPATPVDLVTPHCYVFLTRFPLFDLFFQLIFDMLSLERLGHMAAAEELSSSPPHTPIAAGAGAVVPSPPTTPTSSSAASASANAVAAAAAVASSSALPPPKYEYVPSALLATTLSSIYPHPPPRYSSTLSMSLSPQLPPLLYTRPPPPLSLPEYYCRACDWCLPPFLLTMPPPLLVWTLSLLLSEVKVCVLSSEEGLLSCALSALPLLLRPLDWVAPLIPLLPLPLTDFLDAPTPLLVGVLVDGPAGSSSSSSSSSSSGKAAGLGAGVLEKVLHGCWADTSLPTAILDLTPATPQLLLPMHTLPLLPSFPLPDADLLTSRLYAYTDSRPEVSGQGAGLAAAGGGWMSLGFGSSVKGSAASARAQSAGKPAGSSTPYLPTAAEKANARGMMEALTAHMQHVAELAADFYQQQQAQGEAEAAGEEDEVVDLLLSHSSAAQFGEEERAARQRNVSQVHLQRVSSAAEQEAQQGWKSMDLELEGEEDNQQENGEEGDLLDMGLGALPAAGEGLGSGAEVKNPTSLLSLYAKIIEAGAGGADTASTTSSAPPATAAAPQGLALARPMSLFSMGGGGRGGVAVGGMHIGEALSLNRDHFFDADEDAFLARFVRTQIFAEYLASQPSPAKSDVEESVVGNTGPVTADDAVIDLLS